MDFESRAEILDPSSELDRVRAEILSGQVDAAIARLTRLADGPGHPLLDHWHAAALGAAGDWAGHRAKLREAQHRHAVAVLCDCGVDLSRLDNDQAYALQVAQTFYQHNHVAVAAEVFARVLAMPNAPLTALVSYGLSLQHQGYVDEAAAVFENAYERSSHAPAVHSFMLYALFFVKDGVRRHAEAAKRWANAFQSLDAEACSNPPLEGRKLRLGYYAPSVTAGQARQFILPVLESHDRAAVDVFLYLKDAPGEGVPGWITVRLVGDVDDAAMAAQIREDAVDVMVDLWGHTANGRLGAFARKPAPVQVAWMNYMQTTGLPTMDYLIHAEGMSEPESQSECVEQVWNIGPVISPFRCDPRPEPAHTPARSRGFVTFGSYNHPAKLNDETVAAWSAILKRTPGSELLLRYRYFEDAVLQNATLMRFAAHGVDPERIVFRGHCVQPEYYESYAEIDIALDPSPCPGGTTSNDALCNGLPLLTLRGRDYFARLGVALVEPLGAPELIVDSWEEYIDRAVELASDVAALDALRLRIRLAFDRCPDRDPVVFTRRLEAAFKEMFGRWRDTQARAA